MLGVQGVQQAQEEEGVVAVAVQVVQLLLEGVVEVEVLQERQVREL